MASCRSMEGGKIFVETETGTELSDDFRALDSVEGGQRRDLDADRISVRREPAVYREPIRKAQQPVEYLPVGIV
jgi:hypothetical protein